MYRNRLVVTQEIEDQQEKHHVNKKTLVKLVNVSWRYFSKATTSKRTNLSQFI